MVSWNLKELRDLSSSGLCDQKQTELSDFLDSFDWKSNAARHHVRQADDVFKEYHNLDEGLITHKLLCSDQSFGIATTFREVSLVSAVMTANMLPEVLAQVINIVILESRFSNNEVTSNKVLQEIPSGNLKTKFENIHASQESIYIRAFTNTLKHINLVKMSYHISYEEGSFHGVKFREFRYRKISFLEQSDTDIIKIVKEYRTKCVELGSEINNEIRRRINLQTI
jgi:hypothetical protein